MPEPAGNAANDEVWRLFAAVELPDPVRERLARVIRSFRDAGWRAKWVNPEVSHLTLKFYGSVPTSGIPALADALRPVIAARAPFRVEARGCGAFPGPSRPRVLWVGVAGDVAALQQLQGTVERVSATLGFPAEERAFHPHLTVARVQPEELPTLARLPERLAEVDALPGLPIEVQGVTLMRSQLGRGGAVYSVVDRFPLSGETR